MRLDQILKNIDYTILGADESTDITRLSVNSDELDENTLLIIANSKKITRINTDCSSAPIILCDNEFNAPIDFPTVRVKNARIAMAFAYSNFYDVDYSKMNIIGVSGTNGKTSTSLFLYHTLQHSRKKAGFITFSS